MSKKEKSVLERLEARIYFATRELSKGEAHALRYNQNKMPSPLPEDVAYWRAYKAGLVYSYDVFKDDSVTQMQLVK